MTAYPGLVLLGTIGGLLAVDMPTWRELTALTMVGLILRWMIARENRREVRDVRADKGLRRRLDKLEVEVADQRHAKHEQANRVIALRNALDLVKIQARRCSCGALEPVQQLLEEIGTHDPHS